MLVVALILAASPARAQEEGSPADSLAVPEAPAVAPDTAEVRAERPPPRPTRLLDQPRFVMLRSLLVPGWGQLHNRAWFKAALVAGGEGWLLSRLVEDDRALRSLDAEATAARLAGEPEAELEAVDRYNARLDRFVGRQWLLGGLLVYALMDAYVDAHFVDFRIEFQHDPALPTGVRLGMEKRF